MIEVQGHSCGKAWEPVRGDSVRGVWRTCPACRPGGAVARDAEDAIPLRAGMIGFDRLTGANAYTGDVLDLSCSTPPERASDRGGRA